MPQQANIKLPAEVSLFEKELDTIIQNDETHHDWHPPSLGHLLKRIRKRNTTLSFAGWLQLDGRQDLLDWLYQRAASNPAEQEFLQHWAVACRQSKDIISALHVSHPVMYLTRHGSYTPLHIAAHENDLERAALLTSLTGFANFWQKSSDTPLHIAMSDRHNVMAKALIQAGALVNLRNHEGDTCMHIAMKTRNWEMVSYIFLLTPANNYNGWGRHSIYMENSAGKTPFTIAAELGELHIIKAWIKTPNSLTPCPIFPKEINRSFLAAIRNERVSVAHFLLPYVDNIKPYFHGNPGSAMYHAKKIRNLELVKAICKRRLEIFITQVSKSQDGYLYRFFSFGYSIEQQIHAAKDFMQKLETCDHADDIDISSGAITRGELYEIAALCVKHCCECVPRAADLNAACWPL